MERRAFLAIVSGSMFAAPPVSWAQRSTPQRAGAVPVVGILHAGVPDLTTPAIAALREQLGELGYIEGQNLVHEYRWARARVERLPTLAADLVRLNVDVLYAIGPQAARAAIGASRTIAIVVTDLESDPVDARFIASFARPGGNVTGLFLDLPGLTGKWLQLVREVVPAARRIAVLWDPTTGSYQLRALKVAGQAAGIDLRVLEIRDPREYDRTLNEAIRARSQALIQLSSPLVRQASARIADFAIEHRLPAISLFKEFVDAGGLMTYGPDLFTFFRRAAAHIDKILKGAKPSELPAEQPTKYDFIVNLKTAKALGLTIPQSLLVRADQVIE